MSIKRPQPDKKPKMYKDYIEELFKAGKINKWERDTYIRKVKSPNISYYNGKFT